MGRVKKNVKRVTRTLKIQNEDLAMSMAVLERGVQDYEKENDWKPTHQGEGVENPKIDDISTHGFVGTEPKIFRDYEKSSARFRLAIREAEGKVRWVTVNLRGEKGIEISKAITKGMAVYIAGRRFQFPKTTREQSGREVIYANQIYRLESLTA